MSLFYESHATQTSLTLMCSLSHAPLHTVTVESFTELDKDIFTSALLENRDVITKHYQEETLQLNKGVYMKPWFAGSDDFILGHVMTQAHFPCREAGSHEYRQANWLQSQLAELTNPTTSVVSVPQVSFSLSGWACLACGFIGLFSPRGTVSVPGCSCSATCRFGRGGQSGTLLFFSLNISRSHLICPGEGFSITPLWADQTKQERQVCKWRKWKNLKARKKDTFVENGCTDRHADKQRKRDWKRL